MLYSMLPCWNTTCCWFNSLIESVGFCKTKSVGFCTLQNRWDFARCKIGGILHAQNRWDFARAKSVGFCRAAESRNSGIPTQVGAPLINIFFGGILHKSAGKSVGFCRPFLVHFSGNLGLFSKFGQKRVHFSPFSKTPEIPKSRNRGPGGRICKKVHFRRKSSFQPRLGGVPQKCGFLP